MLVGPSTAIGPTRVALADDRPSVSDHLGWVGTIYKKIFLSTYAATLVPVVAVVVVVVLVVVITVVAAVVVVVVVIGCSGL